MTMKIRRVELSESEFPALLREIPKPPSPLYLAGNILDAASCVAIVGTRRPTQYGLDAATWIASSIAAAGLVVVSGMAAGIDAAAHRGALDAGGRTVAVLGCGVDRCYPHHNRRLYSRILEEGALLSEYQPGVPPLPYFFPARNRIIAGMSLGVVVVEGRVNGGAMITARFAADYGREVFAVPGPVYSPMAEGPHVLLREGASLATSGASILDDLGLAPSVSTVPSNFSLLPDEAVFISAMEAAPQTLDRLALKAGVPPNAAAALLYRLELKGLVVRHPGAVFALAPKALSKQQPLTAIDNTFAPGA